MAALDGRRAGPFTRAMADKVDTTEALADAVIAGDRRALARAITLVESIRDDHRQAAQDLLHHVLPSSGRSLRLGITGAPGVGKSTFIEAFGMHLLDQGRRLAVLAIDPSSTRSGGSILGDKTRMQELSRSPNAFVRPSPSGNSLGGVARRTREALLLVEAAGFDVVIVETVGVGQSETMVADMVDCFLLLLSPGGGDELQGIKRGIMELADLLVVNKADGDLLEPARRAAAEYRGAVGLMRPKGPSWQTRVLLASAIKGSGLDEVWAAVQAHRKALEGAGEWSTQRVEQNRAWLWRELNESLAAALRRDDKVAAALTQAEAQVAAGLATPTAAAKKLLAAFFTGQTGKPQA